MWAAHWNPIFQPDHHDDQDLGPRLGWQIETKLTQCSKVDISSQRKYGVGLGSKGGLDGTKDKEYWRHCRLSNHADKHMYCVCGYLCVCVSYWGDSQEERCKFAGTARLSSFSKSSSGGVLFQREHTTRGGEMVNWVFVSWFAAASARCLDSGIFSSMRNWSYLQTSQNFWLWFTEFSPPADNELKTRPSMTWQVLSLFPVRTFSLEWQANDLR